MKTNRILLTIISIFLFQFSFAQYFQYTHDLAGNRTDRVLINAPRYANPSDSVKQVLSDEFANHQVKIAPNPTKGGVIVQIMGYDIKEQTKMELYDITGKLVFSKAALTEFTSIDLSAQKSGSYFLRIFINDKMKEWKVVKAD